MLDQQIFTYTCNIALKYTYYKQNNSININTQKTKHILYQYIDTLNI